MNILTEKDNPLLSRKELEIEIEAEKNPSFQEVSKLISENLKVEEEKIAVRKIKGRFGKNSFRISTFIYNAKENKEAIEKKKKEKSQGGAK